MTLPARPAIRSSIEVKQIEHQGEAVFLLRDILKVSDAHLPLTPVGIAICQLLDGERTLSEIARGFEERHEIPIKVEQVEELVGILDEAGFLEGGKALAAIEAWRKDPVRKPACAGPHGSYPDEPDELASLLESHWTRPGGPGAPPDLASKAKPVRAVLSPHIDFKRGGHAYAHAWKAVAESSEADLFVVFGTAHAGTDRARFALTRKSYATPLGTIETDVELVERLAKAYEGPDDLFCGELAHKSEHSIEFQMVELAHLYGERSKAPRKIRALPVLCGSIHDLGPKKAGKDARVRAFHDALAKALADTKPERVCFVGGVDLAHVGVEFGDPPLTKTVLQGYLEQDKKTLEIIAESQDADRFHADVVADESRKICGHAPIHALLAALERTGRKHSGEVLCHDWHDVWDEARSAVSFCSVALRDGKRKR